MVFQLQFWCRNRIKDLRFLPILYMTSLGLVQADEGSVASAYLKEASQLYRSGQYFRAARYAFAANEADPNMKPIAYSWITLGLLKAGLPNAASYFFIRTLQSGNRQAIQSVLTQTQDLFVTIGADLFRNFLIRHTQYENYDSNNRSAYLYALGKQALLLGDEKKAIGYFDGVRENSPLWPFALQLRASAWAILGRNEEAIRDFRSCAAKARKSIFSEGKVPHYRRQAEREADDLRSRCIAGEARTLYQAEHFDEADRVYDSIPKQSFVWPDILLEQAWNSFGRREYNRTLGKLVSYNSPALNFVFNSEVDVLRAQSFLALCLYSDTNKVINEFNLKYSPIGEEVKDFVERNANALPVFYQFGKNVLKAPLYTKNGIYQLSNRFVRGPYFQNLVASEHNIESERSAIRFFDSIQKGVSHDLGKGFPGFLEQVLQWRSRAIQSLGGAFVKNSLIDYHKSLIDDFDKIAFIKLDMLKRAKDKLIFKIVEPAGRSRGNVEPSRRDDQFRWSFNGEFWNDELGDYVFGLESECKS
jgi:hypothetical protein